jgi:hypothetical protein
VVAEDPREPAVVDHERLLELVTRPAPTVRPPWRQPARQARRPATNAVLGTSGAPNSPRFLSSIGEPVGPTQILHPAGTAESGNTATQQGFVKYRG